MTNKKKLARAISVKNHGQLEGHKTWLGVRFEENPTVHFRENPISVIFQKKTIFAHSVTFGNGRLNHLKLMCENDEIFSPSWVRTKVAWFC